MSEWVVLDITGFTKSTKAEKVQKILKAVSFNLVHDNLILYAHNFRVMWPAAR